MLSFPLFIFLWPLINILGILPFSFSFIILVKENVFLSPEKTLDSSFIPVAKMNS